MKIAAIDYSKNSPGVVKSTFDDNFNIIEIDYIGFTQIKKFSKLNNIIYYNTFKDDLEKAQWFRENIINFISDIHYCAFEGYSFASKGKLFDIAESTACIKYAIYDKYIPIRLYDPSTIKLFSANKGNADKIMMTDAFDSINDNLKPNLLNFPKYKSPTTDIIDAYFIMKLLYLELKLRYGLIELKSLDLTTIEIFNRVTRTYPENILVRPFLLKANDA